MNVAIYARYSTDQQDKTSIAGQIANCEALASREGLRVVARFHDEGRSGNDDNRPNYQALLKALKRGDFAAIVCDETSRITRNQAELHRLTAELRFRDQFLITCDGVDTRSETSELLLSVKAAIDQMEGRKIGYRTYRSLRERHKDGHSAGGRIYGYTSQPAAGGYRQRVIQPDQARIVLEIFERYANGEGGKTIARDLNERRIPSPGASWNNRKRRAVGWVHTTLLGSYSKASGILRNPIYAGNCTWNKRKGKKVPGTAQRIQKRRPDAEWIEFRDETLRIVPQKLWDTVQAKLAETRHRAHGNNKGGRPPRNLLSGVLICASCGGHYVLRNGREYCCSSHTNGRNALCAQRRTLPRAHVETTMLAGVKEKYLAPGVISELAKRVRSRLRTLKQPDKAALAADLKCVDAQISTLVDTLAAVGKSDALTARLRELEGSKAAIAARLAAQPTELQVVPDVGKRVRDVVSKLEQALRVPRRRDPYDRQLADLVERGRTALLGLIGPVPVTEEGDAVFAQIELGRAVITAGAQERT